MLAAHRAAVDGSRRWLATTERNLDEATTALERAFHRLVDR